MLLTGGLPTGAWSDQMSCDVLRSAEFSDYTHEKSAILRMISLGRDLTSEVEI